MPSKFHLFGSKDRDKDKLQAEPVPPDSAYASSNSYLGASSTESGPSSNSGNTIASDHPQAQVNQQTRDDDEGITTTTVTTTTTTTRVNKNGHTYTQTTPQNASGDEAQRQNPDPVENVSTQHPLGGYQGPPRGQFSNSSPPAQFEQPSNAPPPRRSHEGPNHRQSVPLKSALRSSTPQAPADRPTSHTNRPDGYNYSRPIKAGNEAPQPQGTETQPSTVQNLKSAAAGIHGVGETLRGTFNSSVERHFGNDPNTVESHNRVVQAGENEMQTGMFDHSGRDSDRIRRKEPPANSGEGGLASKLRVVNR